MDIKLIIELYGIACAMLLPICLVILVVLFRRKAALAEQKKVPAKSESGKKIQETDKKEAPQKQEKLSEWELNSKSMTCLRLSIGDSYKCVLTETEKLEVGSFREWTVTEPFVGEINDDTGVFLAKRTGSTYIECGEVLIYYVEIIPNIRKWFAEPVIDAMCRKEQVTQDELSQMIKGMKRQFAFGALKVLKTELTSEHMLEKVFFRIRKNDFIKAQIHQRMEERMERVETMLDNTTLWIHKTGAGLDEIIDYGAFLKMSVNGDMLFGIGLNWRHTGNSEEFRSNAAMFIHHFNDYLESCELPRIIVNHLPEAEEVTVHETEPAIEEEVYSEDPYLQDIPYAETVEEPEYLPENDNPEPSGEADDEPMELDIDEDEITDGILNLDFDDDIDTEEY